MIPEHYARDVVERCEHLIESLLPVVMGDADRRFGGPLGTTFLVAMSTPMILLPIERMLKPTANRDSVADDGTVDESLGKAVAETLGATTTFGDTPFGRAGAWSYVGGQRRFNLAGGMPSELLDRLAEDESSSAALNTPAVRVLTDLRNALAHGGVAYLDDRGRQTDGQAAMLTFVGAVIEGWPHYRRQRIAYWRTRLPTVLGILGIVAPASGGRCCSERTSGIEAIVQKLILEIHAQLGHDCAHIGC